MTRPSRQRPVLPPLFLVPVLVLIPVLVLLAPVPAGAADLAFREQSLELPGPPAALVPADLDGDGIRDLAVVVVYTEWDQIEIEERTEMDQVEGLVEVLTIVPVLLDRREVRAFLGRPEGGFAPAGEPLELPLSVLSLEPGPPGTPAVALTDAGASALRFDPASGALVLEPLVDEPPVLAGTGAFLPKLDVVRDVTGDGVADLLLPALDGLHLYPGTGDGLAEAPASRIALPEDPGAGRSPRLDYPLPEVIDLDGDGLPDLLFRTPGRPGASSGRFAVRNLGAGRFGEPVPLLGPEEAKAEAEEEDGGSGSTREGAVEGADGDEAEADSGDEDRTPGLDLVHVRRLHPDGPASAVYLESLNEEDAGLRQELRQAREPRFRVHARPLAPDLQVLEEEGSVSRVTGYPAGGDSDSGVPLPGGFQDLNGDGLVDLVTVTNDISLRKALGVLLIRRLTLNLGFHPWCQDSDGRFTRAPGPPLESRITIRLNDLELRQRSLFAGDFDGDGRADFVQLGRARRIGIHRGRADCSYPARPDATVRLRDEIRDLALVDARDLDGDGRSDLAVTHPRPVEEAGVSSPVRLDLYLTREEEDG
ncbi:MAG: FG-GAP repeat domain-containing protein [Thermoanaerobaculia bacterium]